MAEVRNTIELNTYSDETNEVLKTFLTYGLKWKAFKIILAKQKEIETAKADDIDVALDLIRQIIILIYPSITEADLDDCYIDDIFNCYSQALTVANNMAKKLVSDEPGNTGPSLTIEQCLFNLSMDVCRLFPHTLDFFILDEKPAEDVIHFICGMMEKGKESIETPKETKKRVYADQVDWY